MNHTIITLAAVLATSIIGYEWGAVLACSAFLAGREHAQAEYRYMDRNSTNRAGSPWYMGFLPESWNRDGLINDLIAPSLFGMIVAYTVNGCL